MSDVISHSDQNGSGQILSWREGDMPYSELFGDQFYCKTDGRLECDHVFLNGNDLKNRFRTANSLIIGELGFGTGLNLCETWRQWQELRQAESQLHFVSFELYPMRAQEMERALSRWPEIETQRRMLVSLWPDHPSGSLTWQLDPQTRATLVVGDALASLDASSMAFDAWFLDGFAPARNPELWSEDLMARVYARTAPNGTFATYAAAGFVRRNLLAAGFTVEKRRGFAGKRDMLCGHKQSA
jgi:tRNA U34 5-methylaminomethyl-2-thiouridine-forming methyltransferase MnmC